MYDQEAKLYGLVLQPTAVGSMDRHLAHQVHVLATLYAMASGCERGWASSRLDFGNSGARGPLCDMRIASESC